MKSRLLNLLISGIIVLSICSVIFFLNNKNPNHEFNDNPYNAPITSKYIPKNTDMVLHWKINPNELPKYIENYQDKFNKQIINKKISFIRDSSFKLISLDFAQDISNWVGDYGSFALFNSNKKLLYDWILILDTKNDVNIIEELESISATKDINERINVDNELSTSKINIIEKKVSSSYSIYLAKDKDNILIASNPKIIFSSIDESNIEKSNTKENYKYMQIKDYLNDGLLLLEISPKKILNEIGQDEKIQNLNEVKSLITSLNIDKNQLNLQGILTFNTKTKMPVKNINYNLINIEKQSKLFEDFILVDNPNQYFKEDSFHPYQKFIASLIQSSATTDYSNFFEVILENTKGNLLWINDKNWVILTRRSDTNKKEISDLLKKDHFSSSNLEFNNRSLEVWSKLSTDENENYHIKENIEAIIDENEETYTWSQDLSSISNFDSINYSEIESNLDKSNNFDEILKIHLGEEKTMKFLNNFYPYILFKSMLGNKLTPPQNIDIAIAVPSINYPDFIKFKINIKTT